MGGQDSEPGTNQENLPVVLPRAATLVNDGFEKTLISYKQFEFKPIIPVTFRGVSMELLAPPQVNMTGSCFKFCCSREDSASTNGDSFIVFFPFPKGHPGFTLPLIIKAVFDYLGLAGDTRLLQAYLYIYTYIEDTWYLPKWPASHLLNTKKKYHHRKRTLPNFQIRSFKGIFSFEFSPIRIFQKRFPEMEYTKCIQIRTTVCWIYLPFHPAGCRWNPLASKVPLFFLQPVKFI